ncbi:HAMP domain-containing protein [Candidatus Accumulibacter phosphatis]|uniref:Methyl-accepting chemotaxis protein n=1 Tax=Candidatus Accumulibacter phosphatis TaxID=327160 RepID=A0A5S4EMH3_9PROT|nr:HAMP domain-containing protein [Candidatus Accumulibacter phosphatis]TMQ76594.1 Methyl-accepting chemotaxis protein [Candidatus Accumulibacter phosphatis]
MEKVWSKFRIGEKIGLGFAVVGLLFAGVVWHYHQTLKSVLDDYQQLHSVFEVRKSLALEIEIEMAAARDAEKDFLIQRQEHFAEEVDQHLQVMRAKVTALAAVDQHSRQTAEQLQRLLTTYQESFRTVAEAWRSIGLDENSGIQGAFRQKVHRLQELSAQYYVDPLYTILLQIRRSEKDLALRKDPAYRDRVRKLIQEFRQLVQGSGLQATVKQKLLSELLVYARTFEPYADTALKSAEVGGGMGPFRDAAHRIEAILKAHHVPHLETNIYKLRRHEKDFLLRGDEAYATMLVEMARMIRSQIAASPLSETDKTLLASLLLDYQQGFLLLVAQRASIVTLTREVDAAARQIAPLITANVDQANQMMAARVEAIADSSRASVHLGLIAMYGALALALIFVITLTSRIVHKVRQMAGLLDDLAYGAPTARVPAVPGGRDEINAMAESLNALLEHRANFLDCWKTSMNEMIAQRELELAHSEAARDELLTELRAASIAKVQQLNAIRGRLLLHAKHIVEIHQRLRSAPGDVTTDDVQSLEHAAQGMVTLLEVLAVDNGTSPERAAGAADQTVSA